MKLKRQAITAEHTDTIESLYANARQPAQDPAAALLPHDLIHHTSAARSQSK